MKGRKQKIELEEDDESQVSNRSDDSHSSCEAEEKIQTKKQLKKALVEQGESDSESVDKPKEQSHASQKKGQKEKKHKQTVDIPKLNAEDKSISDISELDLFYKNRFIEVGYYLLCACSFGLLLLIDHWLDQLIFNKLVYKPAKNFSESTHLCVTSTEKTFVPLSFQTLNLSESIEMETYCFEFNYFFFFWNESQQCFESFNSWKGKQTVDDLVGHKHNGLLEDKTKLVSQTYGSNTIALPISLGLFSLIFSGLGLYFFLCLSLLFLAGLKLYFTLLLLIIKVNTFWIVRKRYIQFKKLQRAATIDERVMVVRRDDEKRYRKKILDSKELVPGDLIEISNNLHMPADVLITHGSCIIKEPQGEIEVKTLTKVEVPKSCSVTIDQLDHKHILKTGSSVLYTLNHVNEGCFGIVLRTGWNTEYGKNARIALAYDNLSSKNRDARNTSIILLFCAFALASLEVFLEGPSRRVLILFATAACPVAVLAVLLALQRAKGRLEKEGMMVHRNDAVEDLGKVNSFLVEQGALGEQPEESAGFLLSLPQEGDYPVFDKLISKRSRLLASVDDKPCAKKYIEILGLCNTLTKAGDEIYGDPLEAEMLGQTPFALHTQIMDHSKIERYFSCDSTGFSSKYVTLKFFEQNKELRAVVSKSAEGELSLLCCGEPFAIESICTKKTLPYNFSQMISKLSSRGFRVIALANKALSSDDNLDSVKLDKDLHFSGLFCTASSSTPELNTAIAELLPKTDLLLASDNCLFAAVFAARRSGLIPLGTRVLTCRTEQVNSVETLLCAELSKKHKPEDDTSTLKDDGLNFIDVEMANEDTLVHFDGILAMSGSALRLLLSICSAESKRIIIQKTKVYGSLTKDDRRLIIESHKEAVGSIGYVFDITAPISTVRIADVSIALGSSDQTNANFSSHERSVAQLATALTHSRAALDNRKKNTAFLILYLTLKSLALLILTTKKASFPTIQLVFLDFVVMLGLTLFQSDCVGSAIEKELKDLKVNSKQFLLSIAPQTVLSIVVLLFTASLLHKARFYDPPSAVYAKGDKRHNPDQYFLYDPFVLFVMIGFLSVYQSFGANFGSILRKPSNWQFGLYAYCLALLIFLSVILLRIAKIPFVTLMLKMFRAPIMFGFEIIIMSILLITILGFILVRKYSAKVVGWRSSKGATVEELVIVDKITDADSRCDKKSKASDSTRQKQSKHKPAKKPKTSVKQVAVADEEGKERKVKPKKRVEV